MTRTAWLLAVFAACDATAPTGDDDDTEPSDLDDSGLVGIRGVPTFRLVVEPAESLRDGAVWPVQSFGPFLPGTGFTLDLDSALDVDGRVTAAMLTPWGVAPLPTEPLAVDAALRFDEIDGRSVAVARTDADGRFSVPLLAGVHTLSLRSDDPRLPAGERPVAVGDDAPLAIDLGIGRALFGRVLGADGTPVVGVEVHAVDPRGLVSGTARTDATGAYELRVLPGVWTVRVSPPPGSADPTLVTIPFEVQDDDVPADFAWVGVRPSAVDLTLVDPAGAPVAGAPVRVSATAVDGYAPGEAAVTVEARTDSRGLLALRVPAGVYVVEVVPDVDQPLGPVLVADVRLADDARPDPIVVPSRRAVSIAVRDPVGAVLDGARVRCTERLASRRSADADADADGQARLVLAPAAHRCVVQPPPGRPDLAPLVAFVDDPTADLVLVLGPGDPVDGVVRLNLPSGPVPAAWATVRVVDESGEAVGFGVTDESGTFQMRYGTPADL